MENNKRPPIEAKVTPNQGLGTHIFEELDGSLTVYTMVGKTESNGKVTRNRESIFTFHGPLHKHSLSEGNQDFLSHVSPKAREVFTSHSRSSGRIPDMTRITPDNSRNLDNLSDSV